MLVALLSASSLGLQLQPGAVRPKSAATVGRALPPIPPAASAAALGLLPAAASAADIWVELNKPPINLNPFEINPAGWLFFGMYGSYLTWSIVRPPSEDEKAYNDKTAREAAEAASLATDFLAAAAAEPGARELPSGLVFQDVTPGVGEAPTADSKVVVHYEGTLANGEVFDSSLARGEPAEFKVGQVIAGWQEGLQLMKPGGKAVLVIPANLAYGPMALGKIPGNSALKFSVELMEVKESGGFFGFGR